MDLDAKDTSGSYTTETVEVTPVEKELEPSAAIEDRADAQNEMNTQMEEAEIENISEIQTEVVTQNEETEIENTANEDDAENEHENNDEDFLDIGLNLEDDNIFNDVDDVPKR